MNTGMGTTTSPPTVGSDAAPAVTVPGHRQDGVQGSVHGRCPIAGWIGTHRIPVGCTIFSLTVGMAFLFLWDPVFFHHQQWATGGDGWGIWRAAHYVGWGDLGGVYTEGTGVVSTPGMPILLAPFAVVSGWLHLTETTMQFTLPHPTAALILQPVEILASSVAIFAADALATRLEIGGKRRVGVCIVVTLLAWPLGVLWGHAEETLALAVAIYAFLALFERNWTRAGWLFGVAVTVQPLVALLLPVLIAASPAGQRLRTAARTACLPVALLGVAFAGNAADTYRAVVKQPTPPSLNHATPWVSLAPVVDRITIESGRVSHLMANSVGGLSFRTVAVRPLQAIEVSAGPGRILYFVFAVAAGLFVWKRPPSPVRLLWIAALVLGARCLFEAVMTPYYLAPPLILAVVVAARSGANRFWPASAVALATSVFAYFRLTPWVWWLPVVAGSAVVLALAFPGVEVEDGVDIGSGRPVNTEFAQPVDVLSSFG